MTGNYYYISKMNKLFISVWLLFTIASCEQKKATIQVKTNILLIVADDLGFTDLGCYGSEIRTPNLDGLAEVGILNTSFHTLPTCSPTRGMLLSGVDNHRNGYGTMESDWAPNQVGLRGYEGHLNFDVVTFPRLLQDAGYHTSIAGKWHQAFPASEQSLWPNKRGFERSFTLLQGGAGHFSDQQPMFSFYEKPFYVEDGNSVDKLPNDFYSSDYYTKKAIEFIDESVALNKPFLSLVTFTAPHWPLQVPDEFIDLYKGRYDAGYEVLAKERMQKGKELGIITEKAKASILTPNVMPWEELNPEEKATSSRIMEVYAAMIERLDVNVGRLVKHLKEIGEYENTLIVFIADNGAEGNNVNSIVDTGEWVEANFDNRIENIGRKNSYIFTGPSWAQVSSLPFRWYKSFATEGGVRTPAIISYPKWEHNFGKINTDFVSVMDLAPTFLEIAGTEHPGEEYEGRKIYPLDGTSLMKWLAGNKEFAHDPNEVHCWELYGRRSVLKGKWKAEWLDAPYGNNDWELFDLEKDPGGLTNLAEAHPDILDELIIAWDSYALEYDLTLPIENVAYLKDEVWREDQ